MIRRRLPARFLALGLFLLLVPTTVIRVQGRATSQATPATRARIVALKGATMLTVTNGTIPNGTVLLRDGKIAAVGANVSDPGGRRDRRRDRQVRLARDHRRALAHRQRRDQRGRHDGQLDDRHGGRARSRPTSTSTATSPAAPTTANVLHGSANPIGGKNQVIKLRWGKTRAEDIMFEGAMPGIKFALGENPKDMAPGQQHRSAPLSDDAAWASSS